MLSYEPQPCLFYFSENPSAKARWSVLMTHGSSWFLGLLVYFQPVPMQLRPVSAIKIPSSSVFSSSRLFSNWCPHEERVRITSKEKQDLPRHDQSPDMCPSAQDLASKSVTNASFGICSSNGGLRSGRCLMVPPCATTQNV